MEQFRGTTIVSVRRDGRVAIAGDGQVSFGNTVMKGNARKVRPLAGGQVIAGFAGGTADAFTLFELFEAKLEQYGNLTRAAIELAKDWRTDRRLRRLEALLCVADTESSFIVSGNGDVIEPEDDLMAIGSGGPYAQAAAMAQPAPKQKPWIMAIVGFVAMRTASTACLVALSYSLVLARSSCCFSNSEISAPDTNASGPAPRSTMARTSSSLAAALSAATTSSAPVLPFSPSRPPELRWVNQAMSRSWMCR